LYAFKAQTQIKGITIPEGITVIGRSAFYNCTNVEEIYFNAVEMNNLNSSNQVFTNAGKNTQGIDVVIGKNVTKIPSSLFESVYQNSDFQPKITSVEFETGSRCKSIEKIESKIRDVEYIISECESIEDLEKKKEEEKNKNIDRIRGKIKEYIEIIIRRGGGNKEYWRNIKERVKDWNIEGIEEEIERMIEFSLEC